MPLDKAHRGGTMHNSIAKRRRLFLLQASAVILAMLALFVVLSSASLARPAPAAVLADLKGFTNAGASDTTQLSVYATNGDAQVPTAAFNALNSKAGGT